MILKAQEDVLGGAFAYTRAVYGPVGGFLVGNSENLEYCLFVALNMVSLNLYSHSPPLAYRVFTVYFQWYNY